MTKVRQPARVGASWTVGREAQGRGAPLVNNYQQMIDFAMGGETGIETPLDLDGQIIDQKGGYWVKFEVRRVDPSPEIPHGIRYSLTLHDADGTRVMGFDNAHAVRHPKRGRYAGRVVAYAHQHRHAADTGVPYEFQDAYQLLRDFFEKVDKRLRELGL